MGMILQNATWINTDGREATGTIVIHDGTIRSLRQGPSQAQPCDVFDATPYLIIPGLIDPHVHFREPGLTHKEGILNGSQAALAGGVTTVLDMPNTRPPTSTSGRLADKMKLFEKKCKVNWGLHFHATGRKQAAPAVIASVKVFMAKSSDIRAVNRLSQLISVFQRSSRIAIHAEDETFFRKSGEPSFHHYLRPVAALTGALKKIEEAWSQLPPQKRPRIIICHVSTADEVKWIREKKAWGWDLYAETCPHYLFFTQEDLEREGPAFKVNPPLRTASDGLALRAAVQDGTIDFLGTDHAPHLSAEKAGPQPPSGIASIEWFAPLLAYMVKESFFGWKRALELAASNAATCYEIPGRGKIQEGYFADLVFLMRGKPALHDKIVTKASWNPYREFHLGNPVGAVMVNGKFAYQHGTWSPTSFARGVYGI